MILKLSANKSCRIIIIIMGYNICGFKKHELFVLLKKNIII